MLLFIFLSLGYILSADGIYTRSYLQNMKRVEDERQDRVWISKGVEEVETGILERAVKGLTTWSVGPVDCRAATEFKISVDRCESIVKEIKVTIGKKFPDSDITYDSGVYTVRWD